MDNCSELKGNNITLRLLSEENATERYASWLNDPEVNKYLETRQVTVPELKEFIASKNSSDEALFLGIFWNENDLHIGNIKLEPIDFENKTAVVGILIGEKDYWGKGVATEAIKLISDYAFSELELKEVTLGVISEHIAAIKAYEKCGFFVDQMKEKAIDHDGVKYDQVMMKKLRDS